MCGIAGFIDQRLTDSERSSAIGNMLLSIRHRGSDHSDHVSYGACTLGHNRLSIIDLSSESDQPFVLGKYTVIYNGEIYNYKEIREELIARGCSFRTQSDTEVLVKAYEIYGECCVDHFMGMWAFAIHDNERQTLFCSRDRFGIKPFYFIEKEGAFYFASEIKALKHAPIFSDELNTAHIQRFLKTGTVVYQDETFYTCVRSLKAGHNLIADGNAIRISRYWDLSYVRKQAPGFDEAKTTFTDLFKRSVAQHLRSDVKVGACLSGGIDSSSLVSCISEFSPFPMDTFHVYYDGKGETDERAWAEAVTDKYANLTAHYLTPSDTEIRHSIDHILHLQDGPIPSSGIVSQYFLFQSAGREAIKVMIDGQGADEYLAGYFNFYAYYFSYLLKRLRLRSYFSEIRAFCRLQGTSLTGRLKLHMQAWKNLFVSYERSKNREVARKPDFMKQDVHSDYRFIPPGHKQDVSDDFFFQQIFSLILPNLLHYEDRNSMAFTIESRLPFLDHRLVEYAYSLPFEYKIKNGLTKFLLRESMRGLTPDSILDRIDKKGFTTPGEVKWLKGPLAFLIDRTYMQALAPLCNMDKIYDALDRFEKGDTREATYVWRLAMLNHWLVRENG
jgi:asparagine synthase (glutamine-hydrolysing)